jgi:hypothetical protein
VFETSVVQAFGIRTLPYYTPYPSPHYSFRLPVVCFPTMMTLYRMLFGSPLVECPEESLYLTREQGYGYFPGSPGQKLKDGSYEILRKLGRGRYSSTWLVSYLECIFSPFPLYLQSR